MLWSNTHLFRRGEVAQILAKDNQRGVPPCIFPSSPEGLEWTHSIALEVREKHPEDTSLNSLQRIKSAPAQISSLYHKYLWIIITFITLIMRMAGNINGTLSVGHCIKHFTCFIVCNAPTSLSVGMMIPTSQAESEAWEVAQEHTAAKQRHSPGPSGHLQWHTSDFCKVRMPAHRSLPQRFSPIHSLDYSPEHGISCPLILYCKSGFPSLLKQGLHHIPPLCSPTAWCPISCLPSSGPGTTQGFHVLASATRMREAQTIL